MNKANFVFWGSPRFAVIILAKLLAAGFTPAAVVANPDRTAGRRKVLAPPPVKSIALEHNLSIFQPEDPTAIIPALISLQPDFFIIAAYAKIIPASLLSLPRLGTLGVHPSLLPDLRGASPIQTAILRGDRESGVSLYLVDEKMDHGPILGQKTVIIDNFDYLKAETTLASAGGELLVNLLPDFLAGRLQAIPQDHSRATFTKKLKTEDGAILLSDLQDAFAGNAVKTTAILRHLQALNPEPGVYIVNSAGQRIKLLAGVPVGDRLVLTQVQLEGRRPTTHFRPELFT